MELHFSLRDLPGAARRFWHYVRGINVILFHGAMGAGKTTFIAALCREKEVPDAVSSPTFSIINEYAYTEHGVLKKLYHIDLYRLEGEADVVQTGVEDCVASGALCLIEWPERAYGLFDDGAAHVFIKPISITERYVTIELPAPA